MYIVNRSNSCDTFYTTGVQATFFQSEICIQSPDDRVFLYTRKRFLGCNNRESNVKSYENLGTNGGNSTLFQCKKPPNSCKARTVANFLRRMKHMKTTKFNEKNKTFTKLRNTVLFI